MLLFASLADLFYWLYPNKRLCIFYGDEKKSQIILAFFVNRKMRLE